MRKIGLDLGSKTCGIAISDDTNLIATGIRNFVYQKNNFMQIINELEKIIKEYENNIDTFVLGFATNQRNGSLNESSLRSLNFKTLLEEKFSDIKVELFDENYSSVKANDLMFEANLKASQRKKRVDKVAATIILQEYLNLKNSRSK